MDKYQDKTELIPGQSVKWQVEYFDKIDSTNSYLAIKARSGEPEGLVAVANYQTSGHGRLNRPWVAEQGSSLLMSMLLEPKVEITNSHVVVMVLSLAVVDSVHELYGAKLSIKWPNDIVESSGPGEPPGRKLGGILSEVVFPEVITHSYSSQADNNAKKYKLVIGLGLNLIWDSEALHQLEFGQRACSLNELVTVSIDRDQLMSKILEKFDCRYAVLGPSNAPKEILSDYRLRCDTVGRRVAIESQNGSVEGVVLDIDDTGELLVDVGACISRVSVGDVIEFHKVN